MQGRIAVEDGDTADNTEIAESRYQNNGGSDRAFVISHLYAHKVAKRRTAGGERAKCTRAPGINSTSAKRIITKPA